MKTIDERIGEKGCWYDSNDNCCVDYTSVVELIEEQKRIDIDKAWELFKKYATYMHPRKGVEVCVMTKWQFVRAMENESK